MARRPRIVVPGQPRHSVQRGNNRIPCFFTDAAYPFYLDGLAAAGHYGCHLHADVLMTNHVHLRLPPETSSSAALTVRSWPALGPLRGSFLAPHRYPVGRTLHINPHRF